MSDTGVISHIHQRIESAQTAEAHYVTLYVFCHLGGCGLLALVEHVLPQRGASSSLHVYDDPRRWSRWFDDFAHGVTRPVHRAGQRHVAASFRRKPPDVIALTRDNIGLEPDESAARLYRGIEALRPDQAAMVHAWHVGQEEGARAVFV